MKLIRFVLGSVGLLALLASSSCLPQVFQSHLDQSLQPQALPSSALASDSPLPRYYSPLQNAEYVSKAATIVVRYGPVLSARNLEGLKFTIRGSKSGPHAGHTILADDQKTVIFKPDFLFTPGEQVAVNVTSLQLNSQTSYPALAYTFKVAINQQPGSPGSNSLSAPPTPDKPPRSAFPDFLTVPQDIPHYIVSKNSPAAAQGDIFVSPFYWTKSIVGSYLLILNEQGQLVYYQSVADALDAWDFKVQPNGLLSYYDQKNATFYLMNSHYRMVDSYQAGDGYYADLHDFQLLPNGNALLMAYDAETVDMSQVVQGGKKDATVTGLVVQELDPSKNVIFEWRSWDHFSFFDSTANLTEQQIDLVHGNSLALANDGNLLLSSRNLSEITKIDLQTGNAIWRMGGKENMFKFTNGESFAYQHDVRQLPNGDITVFDNHASTQSPAPSRGVEYQIDEVNKTVTQVWDFSHDPSVFATYMGNTQRLSNGDTFLSWGAPSSAKGYSFDTMTEVAPDGTVVFDFVFDQPYVSYRAFRFAWQGFPDTQPVLASRVDPQGLTLGYSWNGATEVAAYRVFGGSSPQSLDFLEQRAKTDFETQSFFVDLPKSVCYFQVAAMDKTGNEMARSRVISTDDVTCPMTP